jgi:hypothetical protein
MKFDAGSLASRAAALSLLALVAALVHATVVVPTVGRMLENRESIAAKRLLLGRLVNVGNPSPPEAADNAIDPALYCSGSTDAIVLAAVQGNLQSIAATASAAIRSAQPLPKVTRGSLQVLGLGIDVSGEPQAILKLMHVIESMTPALLISKAGLHRQQHSTGAEESSFPLVAQLDIYCVPGPPAQ